MYKKPTIEEETFDKNSLIPFPHDFIMTPKSHLAEASLSRLEFGHKKYRKGYGFVIKSNEDIKEVLKNKVHIDYIM